LVINKCVTAVKVSNFSGHYLRNRSTLDIGVLGYIGIVQHKEHSPEVFHIPPGTPCICRSRIARGSDLVPASCRGHRRRSSRPTPSFSPCCPSMPWGLGCEGFAGFAGFFVLAGPTVTLQSCPSYWCLSLHSV